MCYIVYALGAVTKTATFGSFELAEAWLARMEAKMAGHSPILPC